MVGPVTGLDTVKVPRAARTRANNTATGSSAGSCATRGAMAEAHRLLTQAALKRTVPTCA